MTEHHPASRSVCAGITVNLGTRDEPDNMVGAAHFVEHMVFKGTQTRDAYEIARSLEAVGGELNAYTTREETCFYASCLKEHLPLALDVLSDLMSNAEFEPQELKKEREVIIQELNMSADQLDDNIFDIAFEKSFQGHELGRSILGTVKTLQGITRKNLYDFYTKRYYGKNMVVSVAGHVDHEQVVQVLERSLNLKKRAAVSPERKKPNYSQFVHIENRPSEQEHLLLTLPSVSVKDPQRFVSYIVNAALGGGMTSRLYQKIREKLGLAYSIYGFNQPFYDSGLQMIYAGTSARHIPQVLSAIVKEIESLYKKGLNDHELEYYKTQVIGGLILDSDDIETRMSSIVYNEMTFGEYRPVDKTIAELQRVEIKDVHAYVKKHMDISKLSVTILGNVNEDRMSSLVSKYMERRRSIGKKQSQKVMGSKIPKSSKKNINKVIDKLNKKTVKKTSKKK